MEGKPVPHCEDCEEIISRDRADRGKTRCSLCENKQIHRQIRTAARQQTRDRIKKQGFEAWGMDAEEGHVCEYPKEVQISPRKKDIRHCGKPVHVVLDMRSPTNPDGTVSGFCRECLAEHVRDLMKYLT